MKRRHFLKSMNVGLASSLLLSTEVNSLDFLSNPNYLTNQNDLSYHTIDKITYGFVRLQYPRLVGKNARLDIHGYGPNVEICCIHTKQGAMGWSSLRGNRRDAEQVAKELIGKKVSEIFQPQLGTLQERHIPFDTALHDLAGVILKKPVYALLGSEEPQITDYYSGMIYFDDLEPGNSPSGIDKILEECRYDYQVGYRQFKLKIGRGNRWMSYKEGLHRDIEVTKKVAEAFPDCQVLVDGNNGFSVEEFIKYLKGIGSIPLFWIEEPFHENIPEYQRLRAYLKEIGSKTLLADGEADPDPRLLNSLIEHKLLDVHLTDIEGLGFTNWRKLMPELKKTGTLASPHAWGTILKSNYTAHLAGGLGNTVTIEGVTSSSDDVDLSGYQIKNGKLIPSKTAGFGMELLKKIY